MPQAISTERRRRFVASVISDELLTDVIQWIQSELSPSDVFSHQQLAEWACDNGLTQNEETESSE